MLQKFVFAVLIFGVLASHNHIEDKTIYKIINKSDNGAITITTDKFGGDLKVRSQVWVDGAGQKWKSKQPLLAKSFEFKPTSDDSTNLNADGGDNIYAQAASKQDTKYWYVKDEGEGVFSIKNYITGTCIASQGLSRPLHLAICDNSPPQQWTFTAL